MHNHYPFVIFGVLGQDAQAAQGQIASGPPCRLDTWSSAFLSSHGGDCSSANALAHVRATATMVKEETVQIELEHSRLARSLKALSVQCRMLDVEQLSILKVERVLCDQPKLLPRRPDLGQALHEGDGDRAHGARNQRMRPRALSAWNVFVGDKRSAGDLTPFVVLAADCSNLGDEAVHELAQRAHDLNRGVRAVDGGGGQS